MELKIKVPTSLDDITVGQSQQISELSESGTLTGSEFDNECLRIVIGVNSINGISQKDKNILINDIEKALITEGEFKHTFKLNGVTYGLIPNFDKITSGEYIDLIKYSESEEDLHRFLAVCYRPIKTKDFFKNYELEYYKGTEEHAETMKELPLSIAKGCKGFFLRLQKDLEMFSLMYMEAEQVKV